jgi:hypothetical protein
MSKQYPGGLITKTPVIPTTSSAPGIWTLSEQAYWQKQGLWPSPPPPVNISWGTPVNFYAGVISKPIGVSLQDSGKVAIIYQDESAGGPNDLTRNIIGTISGTSISFGTAVTINSHNISADAYDIAYDTTNSRIIWAYRNSSGGANDSYGCTKAASVSGTVPTWGSEYVFNSGTTRWIALAYSTSASKFVVSYQDAPNSADGVARVGTVSGTAISFGTATTYESGSVCSASSCYDPVNNAIGILYNDVSIGYTQVIKGTISGTNISFSSPVTFDTSTGNPQNQFANQLSYNSTQGKAVGLSWTYNPSNFIITTTVSFAGSTPTIGTKTTINGPDIQVMTSVSGSNFVAAGYNNSSPVGYSTRKGTIASSTVSYASAELIGATSNGGYIFYESVSNKVVYVYRNASNNHGYAVVGTVN